MGKVDQGAPGNQGPWGVQPFTNGSPVSPSNPLPVVIDSPPVTTVDVTTETPIALTGAVPSSTQGAALTNAINVALTVKSTDGTSTINAIGSLQGWIEGDAGVWERAPQIDYPLAFGSAGQTALTLTPTINIGVPFDRIAWRPDSMALTGGGTTVDLIYTITREDLNTALTSALELGFLPANAGTNQVPTTVTQGISILGSTSIRITIATTPGTFNAGGFLWAFIWNGGAWVRNTEFDLTIDIQYAGLSQEVINFDFPITPALAGGTRIAYRPEGMSLSSGTTLGILYDVAATGSGAEGESCCVPVGGPAPSVANVIGGVDGSITRAGQVITKSPTSGMPGLVVKPVNQYPATNTNTQITINTGAAQTLQTANADRLTLQVWNLGPGNLFLSYQSDTLSTTRFMVKLVVGAYWEMPQPANAFTVYATADVNTTLVNVTETSAI